MRQGHIRSFERRVRTERNPQLLEIESDCVRFYIRQHIVWNFLKYHLWRVADTLGESSPD